MVGNIGWNRRVRVVGGGGERAEQEESEKVGSI
jgi:hypothetical protein